MEKNELIVPFQKMELYKVIKDNKNRDQKTKNKLVLDFVRKNEKLRKKEYLSAVTRQLSLQFLTHFHKRFNKIKERNRYKIFEKRNREWLAGEINISVNLVGIIDDLNSRKGKLFKTL